YYSAPVYPLLNAAGAVWLERSVGSRLLRRAWMAAAVVSTLVLAPILLPIFAGRRHGALRPGEGADRRRDVRLAGPGAPGVRDLRFAAPSDRQAAIILASNYGVAGALDLYGPGLGLPPVVRPHLTYYYWAPARMNPDVVIAVGYQRQDLEPLFADVKEVGTISNSYGVHNQEEGGPIFVCRSPRRPLWQAWPSLKALD
ncbi:MAG: hypothetical protein M3024_14865, partial [Candidatus Dormibacteraeota bacterium]|nr:hypothetical protein [Candidatus Dormibacteraeota bacterium]